MRNIFSLAILGLFAAACSGTATDTIAPTATTVPATTTTTVAPTTTTTLPEVMPGDEMLAILQGEEFAGTLGLTGSITIDGTDILFSGVTSGDGDSHETTFEMGEPINETSTDINVDGFDYSYIEGIWVRSEEDTETDSEGLGDYLDSIASVTLEGESESNGVETLLFRPDVAPSPSNLGFNGFDADVDVTLVSNMDGVPLAMHISFEGEFDAEPASIIFDVTFSDLGVNHEVDAPIDYLVAYESQGTPFTIGYPEGWTASGKDNFALLEGTIGEQVRVTYVPFGDELSLEELTQPVIDEIAADDDASTILTDQVVEIGSSATPWRVLEVAVDSDEQLYIIYATTLVDGGALEMIGVHPAGFEEIDYDTLTTMMKTLQILGN